MVRGQLQDMQQTKLYHAKMRINHQSAHLNQPRRHLSITHGALGW
jgi:hypothetical protein